MEKNKKKYIGDVIRSYRKLKGLTQEELADSLDVSYQQVQQYEYNKANPPLDVLENIITTLEIPLNKIFDSKGSKDLLEKVEAEIEKDYEIVLTFKKNPDLKELVRFFENNKNKISIRESIKILKTVTDLPEGKRDLLVGLLRKVVSSLHQ